LVRRLAARLELLDAFELGELRLTSPLDVLVTLLRRDDAARDERAQWADVLALLLVDPLAAGDPVVSVAPFVPCCRMLAHGALLLDLPCAPLAVFVPLVPV
jgi:hypothetical protein